jgi:hypothetical protein
LKKDNERVIIEANHGVNIKLNPIRNAISSSNTIYLFISF